MTAVLLGAVVLIGGAATLLANSSNPAHADILGVSDMVEDWICGIVSPSEPWESVGDGPESWMSNRNLAQAHQVPKITVDSAGNAFSPVSLPGASVPEYMDQLGALPAGNYTLYEIAGLRGLSWWTIPLTSDGRNRDCNLWNYLWSQAGNLVFTANKILLQVVIATKEAAASVNPLSFLYDDSAGAMSTVFSAFFVPIATLMLILAGLWAGVNALRRKGMRALIGAVGAAAAIMALGGFMYSVISTGTNGFRSIAAIADESVSQVNAVATNALFDGFTGNSGACSLPADGQAAVRGQRLTSCVLADALAYRPWAIGQFGGAGANPIQLPTGWTVVTPNGGGGVDVATLREQQSLPCYVTFDDCRDLRTYLIAQHGGVQINGTLSGHDGFTMCAAAVHGDSALPDWMALDENANATPLADAMAGLRSLESQAVCSPMFRVFNALTESNSTVAAAYSGDVGVARVSQAFASLIGTIVAGLAVLVVALVTMGWHAMTFALFLLGPFKLAYACNPSKTKMATEWLGDLAHAWLARLVYGIVLNLTILLITWMLSSAMSFGLRMVWLGVILVLFWKLAQKLQELVRPGAASTMTPDMTAAIAAGTNRTKQLTRRTTQSAGGAARGAQLSTRQQLARITDPTSGRPRRTVSALVAPLTMMGGAARGAFSSPQAEMSRASRAMAKTLTTRPSTPTSPSGPPTADKRRRPTGTDVEPVKAAAPAPVASGLPEPPEQRRQHDPDSLPTQRIPVPAAASTPEGSTTPPTPRPVRLPPGARTPAPMTYEPAATQPAPPLY